LHSAIRKYGEQAFTVEALAHTDAAAQLDDMERIWIFLMNSFHAGYNRTTGGDGGWTPSIKTKRKLRVSSTKVWLRDKERILSALRDPEVRGRISRATKARWEDQESRDRMLTSLRSPAVREKLSIAGKLLWSLPSHQAKMRAIMDNPEHRKKLSDAQKKVSPEVVKRRADNLRGRSLSPEHCLNISRGGRGLKRSIETRLKISAAQKRRGPASPETRLRMSISAKARMGNRGRNGIGRFT
jgi:hypothetical protein